MTTTATTYDTIYECPDCGEQTTDRRCPDCHLFTRRLGPGGHCPHCDEIVLLDDLTTTHPARSTTETYTEDLTGSRSTAHLLAQRLYLDLPEARARVRAAAELGPRTTITGEPLEPVHPATAQAQAAGLDQGGQPLYVGRGNRMATPTQRLALAARDRGCTRPGCTAPPVWCEVHHLTAWQHGGPTDITNLALVCPHDHHLITTTVYTVTLADTGRIEWTPPTHLDPQRTPRTNPLHHPPRPHPAPPSRPRRTRPACGCTDQRGLRTRRPELTEPALPATGCGPGTARTDTSVGTRRRRAEAAGAGGRVCARAGS